MGGVMDELKTIFGAIADALRSETGSDAPMTAAEMPDIINAASCEDPDDYLIYVNNNGNKELFCGSIGWDTDACDKSYNEPSVIGSRVTNCASMFRGFSEYNQPTTIPEGVTNCIWMFEGCSKFDQPIAIPESVTSCYMMFYNCPNMSSDIYIYQNDSLNCIGMLSSHDNGRRINVYCRNLSLINGSDYDNSLVYSEIEWDEITNGYFNAEYNIYLLSNMP